VTNNVGVKTRPSLAVGMSYKILVNIKNGAVNNMVCDYYKIECRGTTVITRSDVQSLPSAA
jgi:hypothetical protein